ncbi:MAG: hypothetical protein AVDCRST_MAG83-3369, partial [uncultured Arthrobacter sp.]
GPGPPVVDPVAGQRRASVAVPVSGAAAGQGAARRRSRGRGTPERGGPRRGGRPGEETSGVV